MAGHRSGPAGRLGGCRGGPEERRHYREWVRMRTGGSCIQLRSNPTFFAGCTDGRWVGYRRGLSSRVRGGRRSWLVRGYAGGLITAGWGGGRGLAPSPPAPPPRGGRGAEVPRGCCLLLPPPSRGRVGERGHTAALPPPRPAPGAGWRPSGPGPRGGGKCGSRGGCRSRGRGRGSRAAGRGGAGHPS